MKWKQKVRKWYNDYKRTLVCERCGFDDHRALVFHHIRDKEDNISSMVSKGRSPRHIAEEIKKCIVLCANCHLIEHY